MKPLSRKKRIFYFVFFTCTLLIAGPLLVFHSMGYRLDTILGIGQVGGIYAVAPMSEVDFSLDGEILGQSSFFRKSGLFQDIRPKTYEFVASKNGYYDWRKNVRILPEKVAELYPFILPSDPVLTPVPKEISKDADSAATSTNVGGSSGKNVITNSLYTEVAALFAQPTTPKPVKSVIAEDSDTKGAAVISKEKVDIWYAGKNIFARWNGKIESAPLFFCSEVVCSKKILVHTASAPVIHIDFLPSRRDVIVYSSKDGIYAVEIDQTKPQNIQPLYKKSADFRVSEDGIIYIKEGKNFYSYEL